MRLVQPAHPGRVQGQQQVQPERGVGGERAEHPLELADPVAHRVVVEVQAAGRFRDVEVRLEQHPQRLAEVRGVGVGGVGQGAQHLVDVGPQLGAVRDQGQQPEHPQLVEVRDRAAVDLLPDPEGPLGLAVGLRELRQRPRRAPDAGAEEPAHPAQPAVDP